MPTGGGDLRVLLDGPVLEVFGAFGTLAAPIASTGDTRAVSASGDGVVRAYGLR
jgi:hypothetical protein